MNMGNEQGRNYGNGQYYPNGQYPVNGQYYQNGAYPPNGQYYPNGPYPPPCSPGYPPPAASPTQVIINTQPAATPGMVPIGIPITSNMELGPDSVPYTCLYCRMTTQTIVYYRAGECAWVLACLLCLTMFGILCCWVPFVLNVCKDAEHSCGNCKAYIGRYRRCCGNTQS